MTTTITQPCEYEYHRHTVFLCPLCDARTVTDHRWVGGRGNVWMLVCCGYPGVSHMFELSTKRQYRLDGEWYSWDLLRKEQS